MPTHATNAPLSGARVVLFGSEGGFSRPILEQLLLKDILVPAIVMPGITQQEQPATPASVIFEQPPDISSLAGLAKARQIPIIRSLNCNEQALIDRLSDLDADLFLIACFPLKLPVTICAIPGTTCWNLHPSLLPKYRGPSPIYWQLKNNERDTGVTLHEVTEILDAGDIVAQQSISLPEDLSPASLDHWVTKHGVELVTQSFQYYRSGKLKTRKQKEIQASYFPYAN